MAAGPAGQQPEQQAHGGAGVAAVEHVLWLPQSVEALAPHQHGFTGHDRRDRHAHGPQAGGRAERILRRQQAFDAGFPLSDRPKQQGAMGDRFVARHPHASTQALARGQRQGLVGIDPRLGGRGVDCRHFGAAMRTILWSSFLAVPDQQALSVLDWRGLDGVGGSCRQSGDAVQARPPAWRRAADRDQTSNTRACQGEMVAMSRAIGAGAAARRARAA